MVLAAVCALSRRLPIDFGFGKATLEVEIADVAVLTALVLGGPLCALLVAVPSMVYRERLRTAYQASAFVLQILAAAYVFGMFSDPIFFGADLQRPFALGVVAAGLVLCSVDALTVSSLLRIKYGLTHERLLKDVILPPVPSEVVAVLAALATSYAVEGYSPVAALSLFSGAAVAVTLLHLVRQRRKKLEALESEVYRLQRKCVGLERALRSSNLELAARLVQSVGSKDGHTAARAAAAATYAADIARELEMVPGEVEKLRVAALLQDVGMVSVPDEVLLTPPKRLNSVGRMHVEQHPVQSERLLSAAAGFEEAARWVRWHHEREDGTGYPDRLRGEWIPLEAKILAASELYASLVLDGPHSPGLSPQRAREELVGLVGNKLDRQVVKALLRVLDDQDANYAAAADGRFAFPAADRPAAVRPPSRVGGGTSLESTGVTETG